jgi:hypothetical protein
LAIDSIFANAWHFYAPLRQVPAVQNQELQLLVGPELPVVPSRAAASAHGGWNDTSFSVSRASLASSVMGVCAPSL